MTRPSFFCPKCGPLLGQRPIDNDGTCAECGSNTCSWANVLEHVGDAGYILVPEDSGYCVVHVNSLASVLPEMLSDVSAEMKPQLIYALAKALSSLVESEAEKLSTLIEQVKAAGYIVTTNADLKKGIAPHARRETRDGRRNDQGGSVQDGQKQLSPQRTGGTVRPSRSARGRPGEKPFQAAGRGCWPHPSERLRRHERITSEAITTTAVAALSTADPSRALCWPSPVETGLGHQTRMSVAFGEWIERCRRSTRLAVDNVARSAHLFAS